MRCGLVIQLTLLAIVFAHATFINAQPSPDRRTAADPRLLALYLTSHDSTELQKVKSIFYWITANIDYRTANVRRRNTYVEPEDTGAIKPLDERVALAVLHNRAGVCDGYARLFKTLCHYAGLEAEVVMGYGKTQPFRRNQRFNANHSWNAVRIDSTWHLLDVTWASGYLNYQGTEFIRHLDEQYFLSPPAEFIREHYPNDLRWSLLNDPPLLAEFRYSPYRHRAFAKYRFTGISPASGIIEMKVGDTARLELTIPAGMNPASISSDPFLDTSVYNTRSSIVIGPVSQSMGRANYQFIPGNSELQWLYILFNDDLVLRYRLQLTDKPVSGPLAISK